MINENIKRRLLEFNPFWKEKIVVEYKDRNIYPRIWRLINEPQIIALSGLRRTGKTTILRKLIFDLAEKNPVNSILYFSFDDFRESEVFDIIDSFEDMHGRKPKFLFFDEVQKLEDWAEKIKILYDTGKYKIFVSGSESLFLLKGIRESLAGRIYEFKVDKLTFSEFLNFEGKGYLLAKPQIYGHELQKELEGYLLSGGFPELIGKTDSSLVKQFIRSTIIEKIVLMDMVRIYPIDNPLKMITILELLIANPGMLVDFASMSQELGISRQTLSKYFDYLESAHMVIKIYNYSRNRSTSEKRLKKFFPTFLSSALYEDMDESIRGKQIEAICILAASAKFFWRDAAKDEVDLVLKKEGMLLPVEVKYRNDPEQNKGLEKFCKKYNCQKAMIVTKDLRKNVNSFAEIEYIPFYEFLLRVSE